jgi:paraquat-inducible protein B
VSARAHPRAVGAFVLGATALLLLAIVLLSAGDWLAPKDRFVVFFPGSVRGLNPGAPITFRGVRTGEVKEVTAFLTGKPAEPIQIEVVIELRRNVVEPLPGADTAWRNVRGAELAKQLIATGIRGRLLSQSLLTGQKYIEFEFLPNEPARLSGFGRRYPELPTAPSAMERLGERSEAILEKIAELPVDRMLEDLRQALQSLHALLDSPDLRGTLAGARRSTEAIPPALEEVRSATADARRLLATLESDVHTTGGETAETARRLRATLDRLDRTLGRVDDVAVSTDDARVQAVRTLQDLSRTLDALRQLAEYLETHPEALLQGKPKPEVNK